MIKKLLQIQELNTHDLDDPNIVEVHREIISKKEFLNKIYKEWYQVLLNESPNIEGSQVEVGSGAGFIKSLDDSIVTSDIVDINNVDKVINACDNIPYPDSSLRSLIFVDALHHLPNVEKFFSEANRVLKVGGRIIMIEPWNTLWSRFVFSNLHHEPFLPDSDSWSFPSSGPLSGANGALPWILFSRDLEEFKQAYPSLHLIKIRKMMPFAYLLSGGLSFHSLVPGKLYSLVRNLEKITTLEKWAAMFALIVIEKTS